VAAPDANAGCDGDMKIKGPEDRCCSCLCYGLGGRCDLFGRAFPDRWCGNYQVPPPNGCGSTDCIAWPCDAKETGACWQAQHDAHVIAALLDEIAEMEL